MCLEIAVVMTIFAFGGILFGHFEERTPRWRRVLKVLLIIAATLGVSASLGRAWAIGFVIAAATIPAAVIHMWWLPKHGINGWTGEPKDKYYELRGWRR
jgi:hypothetical protein